MLNELWFGVTEYVPFSCKILSIVLWGTWETPGNSSRTGTWTVLYHPDHVCRSVGKIAKRDYLFPNVCLSGLLGLFGSHCTNFHEILYLRPSRKSVERIQVSLKSDKHNWCITRRNRYMYNWLKSSENDKCLRQKL